MEVSVIVPTRNRRALLALALRSALRQRGVDFEVIVVDEGSSDDTAGMLASFSNARLRTVRHDVAQGLAAARNHGAAEARGDWLAFLDDDDLWAPNKLVRQLDAARASGREWAYTGAVRFVGARIVSGEPPLPPEEVMAALLRYNPIPGGGSNIVVRRSLWQRAGPFDAHFSPSEDWELAIRLAAFGPPAWVCSPMVARRLHARNMTLDIAHIVRGTKRIEARHHTTVDWGRTYRWLAHSCLRAGATRMSAAHFAHAAVRGQGRAVLSDVAAILSERFGRGTSGARVGDARPTAPWITSATVWFEDLTGVDHGGGHT